MKNIKHIAIDLIRSQVSDYVPAYGKLNMEELTELMNFAADQDMTNTISKALMDFNMVDDEDAKEQLMVEQYGGTLRYQKQKYAIERLCSAFDEREIPYILLKGAVIRDYYPAPEIRTSSDIDVLVKKEDRQCAIECLVEYLRWKEKSSHINNISYYTDDGVHIELHRAVIREGFSFSKVLSEPWQYAKHTAGSRYDVTNEFLLFYHCAHMAKHFIDGGFGIRFVLDLWLMNKSIDIDRTEFERLLVEGGIKMFVDAVSDLAKVWFEGAEHSDVTIALEKYLFESGVYGTMQNKIIIKKSMNGGRIKYLIKRIFMPISQLKTIYPILDKWPVLYPFCLLGRYVRILTKNRRMAMVELKNISGKKYNELEKFMDMLGMKENLKRR